MVFPMALLSILKPLLLLAGLRLLLLLLQMLLLLPLRKPHHQDPRSFCGAVTAAFAARGTAVRS